jgi:hypothetical protein
MLNRRLVIAVVVILSLLVLSALAVSAQQQGPGTCSNGGQCLCYGYGAGTEATSYVCSHEMHRYGMHYGQGQNGFGVMHGHHHRGGRPQTDGVDG